MLKITGLVLYLIWIILLFFKLRHAVKTKQLSYKELFFGNLPWYRNSRNWILILAILLCEITLDLKTVYLLVLISGLLLILFCGLIKHFKLRNFYSVAALSLVGILLAAISSAILYHL